MAKINYYFTTLSPFVYLAGTRLEQIAERHGASIDYKPLDTSALFPRTGGRVRAERHPSRNDYRDQDLRRQAIRLGVGINIKPMYFPVNPAPSSYAVIAAKVAGGGDLGGLVASFARAVWAEEKNIAEDDLVKMMLADHGFDPAIADKHMLLAAETYAANLEEAVSRGVFGAPFYIVGDEKFWGQDRLDDLNLYLADQL